MLPDDSCNSSAVFDSLSFRLGYELATIIIIKKEEAVSNSSYSHVEVILCWIQDSLSGLVTYKQTNKRGGGGGGGGVLYGSSTTSVLSAFKLFCCFR